VEFFDDGHVRCYAAGDAADVARGALTMTESRRQLAEVVRCARHPVSDRVPRRAEPVRRRRRGALHAARQPASRHGALRRDRGTLLRRCLRCRRARAARRARLRPPPPRAEETT
jgi:hypothetical protein